MENFCQKCRQPNSPDAQFCRFCASPLMPGQSFGRQPEQNSQGYQPASGNFPPAAGASTRALGSVILTVCGLLMCCVLTSIPGAILGWLEINAIKQGQSPPSGMQMAQIGLWGGAALTVINIVCYILFFFFFVLSAAANG